MEETPIERLILVMEDNLDHRRIIADALNEISVPHQIVAIADGKQAMDFLHRRGSYTDSPRPDFILLNFNLPGKDGQEILAEIKADSQLRRIPVVVLTISSNEEDILRSYTLQGNCYVVKSSQLDHLFEIVKRIGEFWLKIVTLPLE